MYVKRILSFLRSWFPVKNCLTFALRKHKRYGGYICFRDSPYWDGFHALWFPREGAKFVHYAPKERFYGGKKLKWWQYIRLISFQGHIEVGDDKEAIRLLKTKCSHNVVTEEHKKGPPKNPGSP